MIVREFINKIGFAIDESQFKTVEARVNSLKGKMQNFGTKATLFLTAPFIALNVWLGKTLSEFEQLDVAFETMLSSADKAKVLVEDMLQFAAKTPFEIREIGPTVKQLLATGSAAETVLDDLRILGNAAAGVNVPVSRLALNFGQVRAQGKLTGREMRDFSNAGINVRKELAKMSGVTTGEIQKMVSKGEIGFDKLRQAFVNMSAEGGIFFDLMPKQAKTLGGMWSNFLDLITLTVKDYQKQLLPMFKGIVEFLIKLVDIFKNKLSPTMKKTLFIIAALTAVVGPLILAFTLLVKVGLVVKGALLGIAAAAKIANLSTSLFMLKFALMGAAVLGILLLGLGIFEDITVYLKGGDSLIGGIIGKLNKFNEWLKGFGINTLDTIKDTIKFVSDALQSFFDVIVGLFMGKWGFAFQSLKELAINTMKTITGWFLIGFQPLVDVFNLVTGKKIKLTDFQGNFDKIKEGIGQGKEIAGSVLGKAGEIAGAIGQSISTPIPLGAGGAVGMTGPIMNVETNINVSGETSPNTIKEIGSNVEIAVERALKKQTRDVLNSMGRWE